MNVWLPVGCRPLTARSWRVRFWVSCIRLDLPACAKRQRWWRIDEAVDRVVQIVTRNMNSASAVHLIFREWTRPRTSLEAVSSTVRGIKKFGWEQGRAIPHMMICGIVLGGVAEADGSWPCSTVTGSSHRLGMKLCTWFLSASALRCENGALLGTRGTRRSHRDRTPVAMPWIGPVVYPVAVPGARNRYGAPPGNNKGAPWLLNR